MTVYAYKQTFAKLNPFFPLCIFFVTRYLIIFHRCTVLVLVSLSRFQVLKAWIMPFIRGHLCSKLERAWLCTLQRARNFSVVSSLKSVRSSRGTKSASGMRVRQGMLPSSRPGRNWGTRAWTSPRSALCSLTASSVAWTISKMKTLAW